MKFIIYRDGLGEFRWTLVAANGEKLADSGEGYPRKGDCKHAIHLLQQGCELADVTERK